MLHTEHFNKCERYVFLKTFQLPFTSLIEWRISFPSLKRLKNIVCALPLHQQVFISLTQFLLTQCAKFATILSTSFLPVNSESSSLPPIILMKIIYIGCHQTYHCNILPENYTEVSMDLYKYCTIFPLSQRVLNCHFLYFNSQSLLFFFQLSFIVLSEEN